MFYIVFSVVFLIVLGGGITGLIMLVSGLINDNQKRWITGAVIIFVSIAITVIIVIGAISRFINFLNLFKENRSKSPITVIAESNYNSGFIKNENTCYINYCDVIIRS